MGKLLQNPRKRIVQRSIGFEFWMVEFFNKHPEFKPDAYCRKAVIDQIKLIEPELLENE